MPSNAPTSPAAIGGPNLRGIRSEERSATGQEVGEWPELVGLEVGRQVSLGRVAFWFKLIVSIVFHSSRNSMRCSSVRARFEMVQNSCSKSEPRLVPSALFGF